MSYTIDVHVDPSHLTRCLRADVAEGLSGRPKQLLPKWFYDERGSALFEAITCLPEYYLTRSEGEILRERADEIAELSGADTLVELGSGTSKKTRLLLDAFARSGRLRRFVPFDVSEPTLRLAAREIRRDYNGLRVHAVAGDLDFHLDRLPAEGKRLVAFLGSTIGNLEPTARKGFLNEISAGLNDGEGFLVGVDLVKDVERLEAAYNDATGVTAEFNRNVLAVINRDLSGNFDLSRFEHLARYDPANEWIEMWLVSRVAHMVEISDLDMEVEFAESEAMRTEISAKFRLAQFKEELAGAGMHVERTWTDRAADFGLILARR